MASRRSAAASAPVRGSSSTIASCTFRDVAAAGHGEGSGSGVEAGAGRQRRLCARSRSGDSFEQPLCLTGVALDAPAAHRDIP